MKMLEIGAFETKTHLSSLLEKVQRGMAFYITKRGKRVAVLQPCDVRKYRSMGPEELLSRFRAIREASKPGKESARELIEMGRRF